MGLIDFVKDSGRKVGLFGGRKAAEAEAAKEAAAKASQAARSATEMAARKDLESKALAADIRAAILSYVEIQDLDVSFDGSVATVSGTARTQGDKEKAVVVAGNTEGVARVDDRMVVLLPEPEARYHTVTTGDTLAGIAADYYGVMGLYETLFEANRPMLEHPDRIYPGQVLRIPPAKPPLHTVQRGDTLGKIAERWYGDAKRYPLIANENKLADPNQLEVGRSLTIPLVNPKVA